MAGALLSPADTEHERRDPLQGLPQFANVEFDPCLDDTGEGNTFEPVLGARQDGWPKHVKGTGIVRSVFESYCGFACWAGQVRIEIVDSTSRYEPSTLYLIAYNVDRDARLEYCNRLVRFTARKSNLDAPPHGLHSTFDSKGIPFYVIDNFEREVILLGD